MLGHTGLIHLARPEGVAVGVLIDRRKIEEAIGPDVIVSGEAIRSTDLQMVDEIDIPELLPGQHPAGRNGREEAVTLAGGEILRSGISEVELHQITVVEIIGETAGHP